MNDETECWSTSKAQAEIRKYAQGNYDLAYTRHTKERLEERGITVSDVQHLLKNGFVCGGPDKSTRPNLFKYKISGKTPNSGDREISIVVIPSPDKPAVKVITVMWEDMR